MFIDFLTDRFTESPEADAIVWRDRVNTFAWLLERLDHWRRTLDAHDVGAGTVVVLESDYSADAVALFLVLIERGCILVPLTDFTEPKRSGYVRTAQGERIVRLDAGGGFSVTELPGPADHPHYQQLRIDGHPGLVLFSSGSTGESKAAVHDFAKLLVKFHRRRHNLRTLAFMLFDHIGGIDTLLYSLSNGSCVITVVDRSPDSVCRAVEKYGVQVLPVTPTFLNLLLLSEVYKKYDLSSLVYITYGTEVMPEETLKRCATLFPDVTLLQKYGTTEVGTLRSKSRSSDSLWMKIGGEGYQTRIVDGQLQIKAASAMLGYLNAPSPFTEDGWFITGDEVIQDGEFLRILGRQSEVINVGGEKVYPAEVENVIQQMPEIADVVVYGERNPLVGNIVCARVKPAQPGDPKTIALLVKRHCRRHLENFKVPVKVHVSTEDQHSPRFKKMRRGL
ncbi:MAG TPA: fatty acid--CoA ligase family protein [Acidobacteriota bacterium]|nr:fatty acid--CoA ligase family protein [Acidobacteriota bacterium]